MKIVMYFGSLLLAALMFIHPQPNFEKTSAVVENSADDITFGTFNIHYISSRQKTMTWEERRGAVVEALREGSADIIGFQEMETFAGGRWNSENRQLNWVSEHFPEYSVTSVGDPRTYPSTQPILYRRERFEALEQGYFFFSPNPDVIYSKPRSGRFDAFCSWSRLLDRKTGRSFTIYNVHFDAVSQQNRNKSARLVAERISSRLHREDGVVLLGDFNSPKFLRPVTILRETALKLANTTGSTYHFYRGIDILPAIDHVFYSQDFIYRQTSVIRHRFEGVWPSDHYPVFVTLSPADRRPAE